MTGICGIIESGSSLGAKSENLELYLAYALMRINKDMAVVHLSTGIIDPEVESGRVGVGFFETLHPCTQQLLNRPTVP